MGARDRAEDGDEHDEDRAGRNGVAEQRDRLIPAGEPLGHDAGADDGGDENGGAQRLRQQPPRERQRRFAHSAAVAGVLPAPFVLPIESSCFCSASLSSDRIGRLTKTEMRLLSIRIRVGKGETDFGLVAGRSSGIGNAPMRRHRLARPHRTRLRRRIVADREHEIELGRIGRANSLQLLERKPPTSKFNLRRRSRV